MSEVTCDLPPNLLAVLRELGEPEPNIPFFRMTGDEWEEEARAGPLIDQLLVTGFYVDDELAERVRRTAGETVE